MRFGRVILRLIVIEIAIGQWRHDNVVAGGGGFGCTADPVHESSFFGEAVVGDFAPADRSAVARSDKFAHAPNEITLEFDVVLKTFMFQAGLAFDAVVPIIGEDLVAADVNVFAGK